MTETVLDLRGIRCPQVVLDAKKKLREVAVGGVLVLECTDPLAVIDVPHFVRQTGNALLAEEKSGDLLVFRIEKRR
ncbi:MAG: sulfurtransferase TusA family protein [Xanthobacteraceae bacterium]|nr:sulfurtransferase TusA family protein [Xanthobacteraceae bacterium]MBX3521815.1 sulfurtransferase TusA family protein [Xanthobacteraceae bacterium]MBX3534466.1 sulfurtransferase TusA family protein [Xanthobacteraceae bacterium]MBX3547893.1 sulfurtransferase TusA family protein [Xanthobacteraceae bacterium]MCW5674682.1 sulfurtransferase TusA family protein [Xanthobacteraceae bacterium]